MQTKLTLSLEKQVIEQAKAYAKRHGISLSKLVQELLKDKTKSKVLNEVTVPEKYKEVFGAFDLPEDFNYKEEIARVLAEKYEKLE